MDIFPIGKGCIEIKGIGQKFKNRNYTSKIKVFTG